MHKKFETALEATLIATLLCGNLHAATLHVWQESPNPSAPYSDWAHAAHVIQDAIDAAVDGDTVLVTNGVYATGRMVVNGTTNRVVVGQRIVLKSCDGPEVTTIKGRSFQQDFVGRCARLENHAVLSGFTLQSGIGDSLNGGGVWSDASGVVTNCIITLNLASRGGGTYGGTLHNCSLNWNFAC